MPAGSRELRIQVKGLQEEQRRAEETVRALAGPPMLGAIRQATLLVTATAKKEAKVDVGLWRASITPEVGIMGNVVRGVVGSNLEHAVWAHEDTRPHWAPIAPLLEWVHRKRFAVGAGASYSIRSRSRISGVQAVLDAEYAIAKAVQRKIARHGTKGDHALVKGIERNAARIYRLIESAVERAIGG